MWKQCNQPGCLNLTQQTRCDQHRHRAQQAKDRVRQPFHQRYGKHWAKLAKQILERDRYRCHWCGGKATSADHLIPKADGGTDDLYNLVAACIPCNSRRAGQYVQRRAEMRRRGIVVRNPAENPAPEIRRQEMDQSLGNGNPEMRKCNSIFKKCVRKATEVAECAA